MGTVALAARKGDAPAAGGSSHEKRDRLPRPCNRTYGSDRLRPVPCKALPGLKRTALSLHAPRRLSLMSFCASRTPGRSISDGIDDEDAMTSKARRMHGLGPAEPTRRSKAVALREQGLTFKQIAAILDLTRQRAHQLVQSAEPGARASRRAARNQQMLAWRRRGITMATLARKFRMNFAGVSYTRCAARRRAHDQWFATGCGIPAETPVGGGEGIPHEEVRKWHCVALYRFGVSCRGAE